MIFQDHGEDVKITTGVMELFAKSRGRANEKKNFFLELWGHKLPLTKEILSAFAKKNELDSNGGTVATFG